MNYLKSTEYWAVWFGFAGLVLIKPMTLGQTSLLISAICACGVIGRGLIQFNSGAPVRGWKSPEFQYMVASVVYALVAFKMGGESKCAMAIASMIGAYCVSRGIAKHYRAVNPMVLR